MTRPLALLALLLSAPASAAPSACPQHHPAGQAPDLLRPSLATRTTELCNQAFGVLHSGVSRGPLWSAEHLTRDSVEAARQTPREGEFHPDLRVPAGDRATIADYRGGPWDRGHMAPSGDMPDGEAQQESFALSNMVPQWPTLNRGPWAHIEEQVRDLARQHGEAWVVTGPAFEGAQLQTVGRVLVPSATWKAVYLPATREAGVWFAENRDGGEIRPGSLDALEVATGVRVFPALGGDVRGRAAGWGTR